jgi:hypothetical protein
MPSAAMLISFWPFYINALTQAGKRLDQIDMDRHLLPATWPQSCHGRPDPIEIVLGANCLEVGHET